MKVAVVGTGYVGLVTGTCFAEAGNDVTCVDIDQEKVQRMQDGQIPIYEPGLETLFHRNIKEGRLGFTTDLKEGVLGAAAIFLALPTPPGENGEADLSYVLGVASDLGSILVEYTVVVDKSTVPVGTAEKVRDRIAERAQTDFDVVSNPEFLREGHAVEDFQKPDRIVIGSESERARRVMDRLYRPFVRQGNPILHMDTRSAELTKYAANGFLATKISFMNEMANVAERLGADIDKVRLGIGYDPRIGNQFLYSGIGYGGSCFPKDVKALHQTAVQSGYDFEILEAVDRVNERQKQRLVEKVKEFYGEDLTGKKFALWGLAFKPDTDDVREAPAFSIIDALTAAGAEVVAFDPEAIENVRKERKDNERLSFVTKRYDALAEADALLIATEWREFRTPDFKKVKDLLKAPVIFDGRNLYDLDIMQENGFHYESIGRKVVNDLRTNGN